MAHLVRLDFPEKMEMFHSYIKVSQALPEGKSNDGDLNLMN